MMHRRGVISILICILIGPMLPAQPPRPSATTGNRILLGRLADGDTVAFLRAASGDWGIEISGAGAPRYTQQRPAHIEVYQDEQNVNQLASGYQSVRMKAGAVMAKARMAGKGREAFFVEDRWTLSGAVLVLPGRTFDLLGPGWQQEHWRMGPGVRGIGAHRTWLPWISVNHLHGITALEEFDSALFLRLSKGD